ncbi:MAG: sigma-54 dependent transcriptional regulator, partial [Calditrichales bacterium]|nr:sigma-54 dependent transcriptional regulator [Calditrichales bacterium]
AFATVETAVDALRIGAYDYLTKPFSPDKLLSTLTHIRQFHEVRNENVKLKKRLRIFENKVIVGSSPLMSKLLEKIKAVAQNDYTVLIEGESGSGKEMVARALHYYSSRVKNPFIPINCAVIPESLLESELFGHEKGAFSGAVKRHIGYFERADKGTIFIDDIDDFPLPLQVKLLRVLQEREFLRVGGIESISVDVRIICASKIDLKEQINKNLFREDLYYRLNIIPLRIPPLRERKDDIPALVEHFFDKNNARDKLRLLNKNIYSRFLQYDWPGNVRELENFVERMIALSDVSSWDDEIFESLQTDYPCKEETVENKEKE